MYKQPCWMTWEVAEEKRHNQRVDVRTIDVGIGHDDNLLVAQLVNVCFLLSSPSTPKRDAQRLDDIVYFVALECLVPHGLSTFRILPRSGDSLKRTVTALLC